MIEFHLPLPPTLNSLYPGKVRRHKSERYKTWIRDANAMLNAQHVPSIKGLVQISYIIGKPRNKGGEITSKAMDLANREKALSDLITERGIIEDDSCIRKLIMEWSDIEGVDVFIQPYVKTV